jgi:hypothetical protein
MWIVKKSESLFARLLQLYYMKKRGKDGRIEMQMMLAQIVDDFQKTEGWLPLLRDFQVHWTVRDATQSALYQNLHSPEDHVLYIWMDWGDL